MFITCCKSTFRFWQQFIKHLSLKHSIQIEKRNRRFKCLNCQVLLKDYILLIKHIGDEHHIETWIEMGVLRRRMYFNGLGDKEAKKQIIQELLKGVKIKEIYFKHQGEFSTDFICRVSSDFHAKDCPQCGKKKSMRRQTCGNKCSLIFWKCRNCNYKTKREPFR